MKTSLLFVIPLVFAWTSGTAFAATSYDYGVQLVGSAEHNADQTEISARVRLINKSDIPGGELFVELPVNWGHSADLEDACQYSESAHHIFCKVDVEPNDNRMFEFTFDREEEDTCETGNEILFKAIHGSPENEDPDSSNDEVVIPLGVSCYDVEFSARVQDSAEDAKHYITTVLFRGSSEELVPEIRFSHDAGEENLAYLYNDANIPCNYYDEIAKWVCKDVEIDEELNIAFVFEKKNKDICDEGYDLKIGLHAPDGVMVTEEIEDNNVYTDVVSFSCSVERNSQFIPVDLTLEENQVSNFSITKQNHVYIEPDNSFEWNYEIEKFHNYDEITDEQFSITFPKEIDVLSPVGPGCSQKGTTQTCTGNFDKKSYRWLLEVPTKECDPQFITLLPMHIELQYKANGVTEVLKDTTYQHCGGTRIGNFSYALELAIEDHENGLQPLRDQHQEEEEEKQVEQEEEQSTPKPLSRFVTVKNGQRDVEITDVPRDSWFANYVERLMNLNIVSGYKDDAGNLLGKYGPGDNVTYAQIAKMAVVALGGSPTTAAKNPSAGEGHWARFYVGYMEENVSLFTDMSLDVNQPAPRGAVVQILYEVYGDRPTPASGQLYSDVSTTTPYAAYIEKATQDGIVSGDDGSTTFRPLDPINRAETAKIVDEFLQFIGN